MKAACILSETKDLGLSREMESRKDEVEVLRCAQDAEAQDAERRDRAS
jgi:hypothetical protein